MMEFILQRLSNLFSVKSIVSLALTAMFAYQIIKGSVDQNFIVIYSTVIAFYFGTQSSKIQNLIDKESEKQNSEDIVSESDLDS